MAPLEPYSTAEAELEPEPAAEEGTRLDLGEDAGAGPVSFSTHFRSVSLVLLDSYSGFTTLFSLRVHIIPGFQELREVKHGCTGVIPYLIAQGW